MDKYLKVCQGVPNPVGRASAIAYLNRVLPPLWASIYPSKGGELLTVTTGGVMGQEGAVSTLFATSDDEKPKVASRRRHLRPEEAAKLRLVSAVAIPSVTSCYCASSIGTACVHTRP